MIMITNIITFQVRSLHVIVPTGSLPHHQQEQQEQREEDQSTWKPTKHRATQVRWYNSHMSSSPQHLKHIPPKVVLQCAGHSEVAAADCPEDFEEAQHNLRCLQVLPLPCVKDGSGDDYCW